MTTLLHPKQGRYGVDLHEEKEKVGYSCTTNSGNQPRDKNNNEKTNTTTTKTT
jgi:hypothetical protein